jgi:hypothetical protein
LDADIKQAEAMASNAIVSIYNQTLVKRAFKGQIMADENHFVLYTDYQELFNELSDDLGKF